MPEGKSFGFITVEGQKDVFFHEDKVVGGREAFAALKPGDSVTFDLDESGPKGPAGTNVQKAA